MGEDISLGDIASSIDRDTSKLASESEALDDISEKMELALFPSAPKSNNLHFEFKRLDIGSDFCITKLDFQQAKVLLRIIGELSRKGRIEGCSGENIFLEPTQSQPMLPKDERNNYIGNQLPLEYVLKCNRLNEYVKDQLQSKFLLEESELYGVSETQTLAYIKLTKRCRVFGLLVKNKFYILWIDRKHEIWNDGKCESNFCGSCHYGSKTKQAN
jgi:hypothetical protein